MLPQIFKLLSPTLQVRGVENISYPLRPADDFDSTVVLVSHDRCR